jgi:L-threonylcarbamoyladenylate synthase
VTHPISEDGRRLAVDPSAPDERALGRAGEVLRAGGLVAFPTETVYGLGAHALDPDAVGRIFAAKGRPLDNPLIVHLAAVTDLERVTAEVTPLARSLAERYWPGPLTLVLHAADEVPRVTRGGLTTIAVRMPDHPVALGVIRAARVPVAAPSANRSGRPSPTTAAHVIEDLGDAVDLVVDAGPCVIGVESTVVDARGERPVVLREGWVTREDLEVATRPGPDAPAPDLRSSPGTRYRHYAPRCAVVIAPPGGASEVAAAHAARGRRVGIVSRGSVPDGAVGIATFGSAEELAAVLYRAFRDAEGADLDVLVVEAVDEHGVGRAVMDRLRRAAGAGEGGGGARAAPAGRGGGWVGWGGAPAWDECVEGTHRRTEGGGG